MASDERGRRAIAPPICRVYFPAATASGAEHRGAAGMGIDLAALEEIAGFLDKSLGK